MKKKLYLTFAAILFSVVLWAQVVVVPPSAKAKTAFAIVTDRQTYSKVKDALYQYKVAVESDGLAAYIVYSDWKNPDEVKLELRKLYNASIPLEGAVFVGDVPIALVRNAQHMTTAFKMNEDGFPFSQSSVPSDRFYDDMNLTFEFIKQDSIQPLHFYYKLREDSPQVLDPSFYSARIKYPEKRGGDKYEAIAAYLRKAAAAKGKENQLDHFVSFTGSAYNSECLTAWSDEQKALREGFPLAFASSMGSKLLNFRMDQYMKYRLFDELQRNEVDVFMFHEHGMPTQQLINNEVADPSFDIQYNNVRSSIYQSIRRSLARGMALDTLLHKYKEEYGLSDSFFDKLNDKGLKVKDSLMNADIYIDVKDLKSKNTNPTFVIFDACYNGSFHEDDYVAGYYIFNSGNTLVAQGNTRNVLQDRWTIEMVGLLSHGVRVGQYNKLVATLEGHLLGDPTVRFTPVKSNSLCTDMVLYADKPVFWKKHQQSDYADIQSLAIRMLVSNDKDMKLSGELLRIFRQSPYNVVRMEALKLLSRYNNEDFVAAVSLGLSDSYEVVARNAAAYAGKIGREDLLKPMAEAYVSFKERDRVVYNLFTSFQKYPNGKVISALSNAVNASNILDKEGEIKKVTELVERQNNSEELKLIADTSQAAKKRIMAIRVKRNYTDHHNIDSYLQIVANSSDDLEVRVVMAEALGWFNHSYRKVEIISALEQMLAKESYPQKLELEIKQTIARLK